MVVISNRNKSMIQFVLPIKGSTICRIVLILIYGIAIAPTYQKPCCGYLCEIIIILISIRRFRVVIHRTREVNIVCQRHFIRPRQSPAFQPHRKLNRHSHRVRAIVITTISYRNLIARATYQQQNDVYNQYVFYFQHFHFPVFTCKSLTTLAKQYHYQSHLPNPSPAHGTVPPPF